MGSKSNSSMARVGVRGATEPRRRPLVAIFTEQYFTERAAEVCVEDRVDDRVEEAVAVPEPVDRAGEQRGHAAVFPAERADKGENEERKPAPDEGSGYDGQRAGRLPFSCLFPLLAGFLFLRLEAGLW